MKKIFTIFILLSGFNQAFTQYSELFLPNTVDARSYGLGRTDIMSVNGSNSIFSNPALLGTITNKQVQFGGCVKAFDLRSELIAEITDDYKNKYAIAPKINHLSFAMPYHLPVKDLKLGLGAGVYSAMDNTFKISTEYKYDNIKVSELISHKGGLNLLAISASLNYKDRFFAGLSLNKSLFSSFASKSHYEEGDFELSREEKTKLSATSFCFGAYVNLTPEFSVGLNYRSKFQLNVDDTEWEEESDGDDDEGEYDNEDIDIPSMYGIGVQYKLSSGITLVGEYHSRPFSDYEEGFDRVFEDLDDGKSYRFGVEFSQSKPIYRLGLFYDALPMKDYDDDKPKSILGITAGTRFDFSNVLIDGYLEFGSVKVEEKFSGEKFDTRFSKFSIGISAKYVIGESQMQKQAQKINTTLE